MALGSEEIARIRVALEDRLAMLANLSEATEADRKPVTLQQDSVGRLSRMDAMQQQAMARASERRRQQEAQRIRAALARIDAGEFGFCATCGEAIAPRRLALDASVATCIRCASGG